MSQRFIVLTSAAVLCGFATSTAAQPAPVIRPEHPDLRKMIDDGAERSATFQNLIARLEATSLVVYIRFDRCAGGVAACTRIAAPQDATRRLLIVLDKFGRGPSDLIALLAHELQHAIEIAEAPHVVDEASFRHFYATTGLRHSAGYETAAALHVTRTVASELANRRRR